MTVFGQTPSHEKPKLGESFSNSSDFQESFRPPIGSQEPPPAGGRSDCWRKLTYTMYLPPQIGPFAWYSPSNLWCCNVKSNCNDNEGKLKKECLCLPAPQRPENKNSIKLKGGCTVVEIVRVNYEGPNCPQLCDCRPSWEFTWPKAGFQMTVELCVTTVTPASVERALINAAEQSMSQALRDAALEGKDLTCCHIQWPQA